MWRPIEKLIDIFSTILIPLLVTCPSSIATLTIQYAIFLLALLSYLVEFPRL